MSHSTRLLLPSLLGVGLVVATILPGQVALRASERHASAPGVTMVALQTQPAQDEFVPIDELPPEERLPAAPLLIAAYGFVWLALLGYLWSIWRRLGGIEREIAEVSRRVATGQDR